MIKTGKFIQCKICKEEFYIPKHRFETAKFCSPTCRGKSAQKQFISNCKICNKQFGYIACREGKAKYCSRKCYYKGQHLNGTIVKNCLYCSKEFRTSPSHKRKFCSILCKSEAFKNIKTKNFTNPRLALKRRNMINKCFDCGYSSHPEILGIHHKDNNRKNNFVKNFIILCPNCHSIRHKKHIPH